jgi:hypothetical protein
MRIWVPRVPLVPLVPLEHHQPARPYPQTRFTAARCVSHSPVFDQIRLVAPVDRPRPDQASERASEPISRPGPPPRVVSRLGHLRSFNTPISSIPCPPSVILVPTTRLSRRASLSLSLPCPSSTRSSLLVEIPGIPGITPFWSWAIQSSSLSIHQLLI